jgi:hypothetical protein
VLKPVNQDVEAGGEPLVAVVDPDVFAQGDQGGEGGSEGSERKNWCSWDLVAGSRTRCSLTEVEGLLTAKPMV